MKNALLAVLLAAALSAGAIFAHRAVEQDRKYQLLVQQGDQALTHGQTFVAIQAFTGAIALKRESMLAYLRRGEAQARRGDATDNLSAALRDFRTAAALDPTSTRVQEKLGDVNFQLHRYGNAVECYEAYLRLDNRSAAVLYKLALASRATGHLSRAIEALEDAIAVNPSSAEMQYLLGLSLKDHGDAAAAEKALRQAITLSPALISAREELADVHRWQGEGQEEIEQLEALAALDPTRPERWIAVGMAYSRAGDPDLAVTALGRAAERFHDYPGVYAALGEVWLDVAEDRSDKAALRKALEALEPVASQPNAASQILTLYGRALVLNNQPTEGEAIFKRAVQRFPVDPSAHVELADVAQRLGHLDDARESLERYLALEDDDRDEGELAQRIAELSLALKDPLGAVRWYEKAAVTAGPSAVLLAHLADAHWRAGHADLARTLIASASAADAKDPSIRAIALRIQGVPQPIPEKVEPQNQ